MKSLKIKILIVGIIVLAIITGVVGVFIVKNQKTTLKEAEDVISFIEEQSEAYGYENALSELKEKNSTAVEGDSYYRLQQQYQGIPVYGRTVVCVTDEKDKFDYLTGNVKDVDSDLDLSPSVTAEQVIESVQQYFTDVFAYEMEVELLNLEKEDLYIYNLSENESARLVYEICLNGYQVVVDAHTAEVISISEAIRQAYAKCTYEIENNVTEFTALKNDEGQYLLKDVEQGIYIYDAEGQDYWYPNTNEIKQDCIHLVSSKDTVFGNEKWGEESGSQNAVIFLEELKSVKNFYASNFQDRGPETLVGIFNNDDIDYGGTNGGGGYENIDKYLSDRPLDYDNQNGKIGLVLIGYANNGKSTEISDLYGHEYTHVMTGFHVGWVETNLETGAINEGFSDIFGELYEASRSDNNEADWIHGDRIIRDPSENEYPEKVGEKEIYFQEGKWCLNVKDSNNQERGMDYSHGYSTVISHAAYLMYNGINGDEQKKIDMEQLGELWYRTMLLIPADCSYVDCAQEALIAAQSMEKLTDEQRICVEEAFEKVGISTAYTVGEQSELHILDTEQELYGGVCELHIKEMNHISGDSDNLSKANEYHELIGSGLPYVLDLEPGIYECTITNKEFPNIIYSFRLQVNSQAEKQEVVIQTEYSPMLIVDITSSNENPALSYSYQYLDKIYYLEPATEGRHGNLSKFDHNGKQTVLTEGEWFGEYLLGLDDQIIYTMGSSLYCMNLTDEKQTLIYDASQSPEGCLENVNLCGMSGTTIYFSGRLAEESGSVLCSLDVNTMEMKRIVTPATYGPDGVFHILNQEYGIYENTSLEEKTPCHLINLKTGEEKSIGSVPWCYYNNCVYVSETDSYDHYTGNVKSISLKTEETSILEDIAAVYGATDQYYLVRMQNEYCYKSSSQESFAKLKMANLSEVYLQEMLDEYFIRISYDGGFECLDLENGLVYFCPDYVARRVSVCGDKILFYDNDKEYVQMLDLKEYLVGPFESDGIIWDNYAAYERLLDRYREACAISESEWFSNQEYYNSKYQDLNITILNNYHTAYHEDIDFGDEPYALAYEYYDIDQNSIPELILYVLHHEPSIKDIYTFDGKEAIRVFKEYEDKYSGFGIYTNGIISCYYPDICYFKLDDTGYGITKVQVNSPMELTGKEWYYLQDNCVVFAEDIPASDGNTMNEPIVEEPIIEEQPNEGISQEEMAFSEDQMVSLVEKHYNEIAGREDAYSGQLYSYNGDYIVHLYYYRDDVDPEENPYASVNVDAGYVTVDPVTGVVLEEDGTTWSLYEEL